MRLWTLHPGYLDSRGLVALWREGLLAQAVLRGRTRGYRHHPQLIRFRAQPSPLASIARYLKAVHDESRARGYAFDRSKVGRSTERGDRSGRSRMTETEGQLLYEWAHLLRKLRTRDRARYREYLKVEIPDPHPIFRIVKGAVNDWEKTTPG